MRTDGLRARGRGAGTLIALGATLLAVSCGGKGTDLLYTPQFQDPTSFVGPLTIATQFLGEGVVDEPETIQVRVLGGTPPYRYDANDITNTTSTLPPGLAINPETGLISGIPTQQGTYQVTIGVQDKMDQNPPGTRVTTTLSYTVRTKAPSALTAQPPTITASNLLGVQRGAIPLFLEVSDPNFPNDATDLLVEFTLDASVATPAWEVANDFNATSGTGAGQNNGGSASFQLGPGQHIWYWDSTADEQRGGRTLTRRTAVRLKATGTDKPDGEGVSRTSTAVSIAGFLMDNVALTTPSSGTRMYTAGAGLVMGQASVTRVDSPGAPGYAAATNYQNPLDVATDGTRQAIADRDHNRVLVWADAHAAGFAFGTGGATNVFNTPPTVVLGQADLNSVTANRGQPAAANSLNKPSAVEFYGDQLFVADTENNRVLVWNSIGAAANGANADVVLGQRTFTDTQPGNTTMGRPQGLATWADRLFVCDTELHRVLVYTISTLTNGATPVYVLGWPSYTTPPTDGFGQSAAANRFVRPRDCLVANGHFYVADTGNNRVLGWTAMPRRGEESSRNGVAADFVLGQRKKDNDFLANMGQAQPSAASMNAPSGLAFDGTNLLVSDAANHRVMRFSSTPITDGPSASYVVALPGLTTAGTPSITNVTNNDFYDPRGIVVSNGRLFVADSAHHRVLGFQ